MKIFTPLVILSAAVLGGCVTPDGGGYSPTDNAGWNNTTSSSVKNWNEMTLAEREQAMRDRAAFMGVAAAGLAGAAIASGGGYATPSSASSGSNIGGGYSQPSYVPVGYNNPYISPNHPEWKAWRDCVPNSILPGGCDSILPGGGQSIGPGGGQSILPGGGQSILPGGGQSILPGGGQSILPGGGQSMFRDRRYGLNPDTGRPYHSNQW